MGIKNLMKIINKYAPETVTYNKIDNYKNSIVAIDGNLLLYKVIYAIRKNGYDLKNEEIIITHLFGFIQKIKGFIYYNITPIFVFDGIAPEIKQNTLKQRLDFHNHMKQKYYKAITQDEKKKYYYMKSDITFNEIMEVMELIKLFNFTVIEAPEEADSQLAELSNNNNKKIDYIITDDLDILIFGGSKILKNFTVSDTKKIQQLDLTILKKQTGLNQKQLIDLAILLGCDYCPSIKGIGAIGAYKLIKKYDNIENIMKNENINLSYDYKKARKYFTNPPVYNSNNIKINKLKIDKNNLTIFLKKFKFTDDYIEKLFKQLEFNL